MSVLVSVLESWIPPDMLLSDQHEPCSLDTCASGGVASTERHQAHI